MHHGPATPMLASALLLASSAFVSCTSTSKAKDDAPPPTSTTAPENRTVDVRVEGGEATLDGDTIKVEYAESDDINDRIPTWVINPTLGGVTGAVGVAAKNDLGMREQLDEARLNGRLELAAMLEVRVQRVGRSELEQDVRVEGGSPRNRSRRDTLGIERDIRDSVLAGSRQRALWFDDHTGECYIWMVLDGAILERVDHVLVQDVSVFTANSAIKNEYKPDRKKALPPTVVVQMPDTAPAPEPEAPKTPVEELEGSLKPIETIPVKGDD